MECECSARYSHFSLFRAEREWQRGETVEAVHQIHGIVPVLSLLSSLSSLLLSVLPIDFPSLRVVVVIFDISDSLFSFVPTYNHDRTIQTLHTRNSQTVTVTATHQISIVIIGPRLAPPSRSRSHWRLSTQHPPLPLTVLRLYPALWSLLPRTSLPLSSLVSSRNSCFALFNCASSHYTQLCFAIPASMI